MLSFFIKNKGIDIEKEVKATDKKSLSKNIKTFSGKIYATYGTFEVENTPIQLASLTKSEENIPLKLPRL